MKSLIKKDTQKLRKELQNGTSEGLKKRRGIIALSLLGMGAMTAVTLLQTGIVKHLPDPPLPDFDSDKVNSSDTAYALGVPDGAMSLASLGGKHSDCRVRRRKSCGNDAARSACRRRQINRRSRRRRLVFLSNADGREKMVRLLHCRCACQHRHRRAFIAGSEKSVAEFD